MPAVSRLEQLLQVGNGEQAIRDCLLHAATAMSLMRAWSSRPRSLSASAVTAANGIAEMTRTPATSASPARHQH